MTKCNKQGDFISPKIFEINIHMTKEEILNFAKEHKVKLSVTYQDDEIQLNKIIILKLKRCQGIGGKFKIILDI